MVRVWGALTAALVLTGCTSVKVQPLESRLDHVCIQLNPAVKVDDFLQVLRDGFARHRISTSVYEQPQVGCNYILEYTARRSWDITPYLSSADLTIRDDSGQVVGQAHYHLRGKGGLSLSKWQGTEAKMAPIIDALITGKAAQD
jgi:hypothetical protein